MTEKIKKTEAFLRERLKESPYFQEHPEAGAYRLEHTFRVARIGMSIARAEGMDPEALAMACLLHDVSYCRWSAASTQEDWLNHGRESARIARPFLESLGLPPDVTGEICYGVAIHVDDKADFPGEATAFARTVGDADNIDRFDVYRLYETLESMSFSKLSLGEKQTHVAKTLERLEKFLEMPLATPAATALWRERIGVYRDFYRRLAEQLSAGLGFEEAMPEAAPPEVDGRLLGPSGHF